jgi:hypothetical protein
MLKHLIKAEEDQQAGQKAWSGRCKVRHGLLLGVTTRRTYLFKPTATGRKDEAQ